jgi:hypothetical protein
LSRTDQESPEGRKPNERQEGKEGKDVLARTAVPQRPPLILYHYSPPDSLSQAFLLLGDVPVRRVEVQSEKLRGANKLFHHPWSAQTAEGGEYRLRREKTYARHGDSIDTNIERRTSREGDERYLYRYERRGAVRVFQKVEGVPPERLMSVAGSGQLFHGDEVSKGGKG